MGTDPSSEGKEAAVGFSARERAAMQARAAELQAEAESGDRGRKRAAKDEAALLEKIAEMSEADRALAERVHALVTAAAPDLAPKLYYGQPAYASGKDVVCFFRSGRADGEPYSTFGFGAAANLGDPSGLWPTSYALADDVNPEAWDELARLVERAVR